MYRPSENCNRVKSIKSKFESIENHGNINKQILQNSSRHNLNQSPAQLNLNVLRASNSVSTKIQSNPGAKNELQSKNINTSALRNGFKSEFPKMPAKPDENISHSVYGSSKNVKSVQNNLGTNRFEGVIDTLNRPKLDRQLSDPVKRNIKRTPAFRVDKSSENISEFQRNVYNRNTLFEKKVKQFNSVKTCDKNFNLVDKNCVNPMSDTDAECVSSSPATSASSSPGGNNGFLRSNIPFTRPSLIKSKSSHDFTYIRNKFDVNSREKVDQSSFKNEENLLKNVDLSLLYTEPIPKALRQRNFDNNNISEPVKKLQSIYTNSTLKLTDKKEFIECLKKTFDDLPPGLTDSLKCALKKPLPNGPPPQKPPRTFQHAEGDQPIEKNKSFLHVVSKELETKTPQKPQSSPSKKIDPKDPKYKLKKLENALKNNKLRARRQAKIDFSTTSGEDSDDSLLFRSKSCRTLPNLPSNINSNFPSSAANLTENLFGDFNCLSGVSCTNPAYERIKEPTSNFFVDNSGEPIYAEPYNHLKTFGKERKDSTASSRDNRNSLYYMSTSLLNGHDTAKKSSNRLENGDNHREECVNKFEKLQLGLETGGNKQASAENSSLSSFTSDLDLTPSPVIDDARAKISCMIKALESGSIPRNQQAKVIHGYDNLPLMGSPKVPRQVERIGKFPVEPAPSSPSSGGSSPVLTRSRRNTNESLNSTNRVEAVKRALEMTLNESFRNDKPDRDSECETQVKVVADMITKFETYSKSVPKYCQPKVLEDKLFYCCLVIEKVRDCVQIKYKFPPKVQIPQNIETLCFPEGEDTPPLERSSEKESAGSNTYSLVLTSVEGERTFGYCRRVLPEGSSHYLPLAYCILSKHRAPKFYSKILTELESRHGMQNKYRDKLISQFFNKKFPKPGESIMIDLTRIEPPIPTYDLRKDLEESLDLSSYVQVNKTNEYASINKLKINTNIFLEPDPTSAPTYTSYENRKCELVITRPPDTRYEDADLKRLHKLPDDILLKVFSSLLLERKIIFISAYMSELSSCMDSIQSILYPFTWSHTFIPILPESLWECVESPTPLICGVLSTDAVLDRKIENGMVVNLDTRSVLQEEGDETKILSDSMKKVWKRSINLAHKAAKAKDGIVESIFLADSYLQVFISCLKNYRNFIVDGQFDTESFLKKEESKGKQRFLKMFTETCMFYDFKTAAVKNSESLADFDKKIVMYGSGNTKEFYDKLYAWKK